MDPGAEHVTIASMASSRCSIITSTKSKNGFNLLAKPWGPILRYRERQKELGRDTIGHEYASSAKDIGCVWERGENDLSLGGPPGPPYVIHAYICMFPTRSKRLFHFPSCQPIGIMAAATCCTPRSVARRLNCAAALRVSDTSSLMPRSLICFLV